MLHSSGISCRKYVGNSVARIINNVTDYPEKKPSCVLNSGPRGGGLIIFLLPFDILVTKFQLYFIRKDYSKGNNIVENNILRI